MHPRNQDRNIAKEGVLFLSVSQVMISGTATRVQTPCRTSVLISATTGGNTTTIKGTINSAANAQFRLEFFSNVACDSTGFSEGERFLGSTDVGTDGIGNSTFTAHFPVFGS